MATKVTVSKVQTTKSESKFQDHHMQQRRDNNHNHSKQELHGGQYRTCIGQSQ